MKLRESGDDVNTTPVAWSIRSVLVSVTHLDRSISFYNDVMGLREVFHEGEIAVLGNDESGSLSLFLRQAIHNAVHPGQDAVGFRTLSCDVGSIAELDRVEERLQTLDAFRDRQTYEGFELVRGHDPDRLPVQFLAYKPDTNVTADDYRKALAQFYSV